MEYLRAFSQRLHDRLFSRLEGRDRRLGESHSPERGIALFMVIIAMTVLSILVTEFVYIAQVNSRMAFDGLDQVRAIYLAKTGYKLSLLRLKAFKTISDNTSLKKGIPREALEKLWNFPFIYPIPTLIPGLTPGQKDDINKFTTESALQGGFTASIQPESSKYNLNSILPGFMPAPKTTPSPGPSAQPSPSPSYDPVTARADLGKFLEDILKDQFTSDQEFATEYRDFKVEELVDAIASWADKSYTALYPARNHPIKPKQSPFYSISELHMLPYMDDRLYDLFAPKLTTAILPGINVNHIEAQNLRAFFKLSEEETKEFIKFRDDPEKDNSFKTDADFWSWLGANTAAYRSTQAVTDLKADLSKRGMRVITDEESFKISVQATSNNVTRTLIAWVEFDGSTAPLPGTPNSGNTTSPSGPNSGANGNSAPSSGNPPSKTGLRITFMRLL